MNSKQKEKTQHLKVQARIINKKIKIQVREEKKEISYIDQLYIELNGRNYYARNDLLLDLDKKYLIMKQNDIAELEFDISDTRFDDKNAEINIVSTGYYIPQKH